MNRLLDAEQITKNECRATQGYTCQQDGINSASMSSFIFGVLWPGKDTRENSLLHAGSPDSPLRTDIYGRPFYPVETQLARLIEGGGLFDPYDETAQPTVEHGRDDHEVVHNRG